MNEHLSVVDFNKNRLLKFGVKQTLYASILNLRLLVCRSIIALYVLFTHYLYILQ